MTARIQALSRSSSRSSLACQACRSQHLKCDSVRPICTRCEALSKPCSYPEPRRGPRDRSVAARRVQGRVSMATESPSRSTTPSYIHSTPPDPRPDNITPRNAVPDTIPPLNSKEILPNIGLEDSFLDLYYQHFHPSHPFVLPKVALQARLRDEAPPSLEKLAKVMRHVGSFYQESIPVNKEYVETAEYDVVDGFLVQATLLQALVQSMCDDSAAASERLTLAIAQATSIGMDKSQFANEIAAVDPVMAESCRRTWWMIYVTDMNFAIIRWDFFRFLAYHSAQEVDLPCDEHCYNRLDIPMRSPSFEEYQNREYALLEQPFSSFAYYIEASTIYLESLQASTLYQSMSHAENVCSDWEATVVSWFLMLPSHLRELPANSTVPDQLMFQAHMMMHTSLAFIHRPLSSLHYDAAEERSSCRPPPPPLCTTVTVVDPSQLEMHSEKLFRAIRKQIQHLVLLPIRAVQLSPFIICMVACCTIVHLVACKVAFNAEETRAARSRIRVTLGTLKHYEDIWPRAKRLITDLKLIANDLLQTTTATASPPILSAAVPILDESTFSSMVEDGWSGVSEK
ncbi:hypothetical protein NLG97_g2288 [Lecanicillium saksenae]|uniref:Uncharacterized protein n=1 Tax=Lecanicillium saksenae TaxID=468837 RepID=A0ACC1R4S1_9HYPO|nr:hypothetical protein NLG97_g2288 [Lecanicillium saksenae]